MCSRRDAHTMRRDRRRIVFDADQFPIQRWAPAIPCRHSAKRHRAGGKLPGTFDVSLSKREMSIRHANGSLPFSKPAVAEPAADNACARCEECRSKSPRPSPASFAIAAGCARKRSRLRLAQLQFRCADPASASRQRTHAPLRSTARSAAFEISAGAAMSRRSL